MYFQCGSFWFAEDFSRCMREDEFDRMTRLFCVKYWGNVDKERWKLNDDVSLDNQGEIVAEYEDSNGNQIIFIVLEDRTRTFIGTKTDLEKGQLDKLKEEMEKSRAQSRKIKTMLSNTASTFTATYTMPNIPAPIQRANGEVGRRRRGGQG